MADDDNYPDDEETPPDARDSDTALSEQPVDDETEAEPPGEIDLTAASDGEVEGDHGEVGAEEEEEEGKAEHAPAPDALSPARRHWPRVSRCLASVQGALAPLAPLFPDPVDFLRFRHDCHPKAPMPVLRILTVILYLISGLVFVYFFVEGSRKVEVVSVITAEPLPTKDGWECVSIATFSAIRTNSGPLTIPTGLAAPPTTPYMTWGQSIGMTNVTYSSCLEHVTKFDPCRQPGVHVVITRTMPGTPSLCEEAVAGEPLSGFSAVNTLYAFTHAAGGLAESELLVGCDAAREVFSKLNAAVGDTEPLINYWGQTLPPFPPQVKT
jgi:hypothetical protein